MVEITDEDSARAWLETQPKRVCVAMAARAALRGLAGLGKADATDLSDLLLSVLRASLTSGATATCPAPAVSDLERAAEAAARSADNANKAAAHYVESAAYSAAHSAVYALYARSAESAVLSAESAASSAFYSAISVGSDDSDDSIAFAASRAGSAGSALSAAYSAFKRDADVVTEAESPDLLFRSPVWQRADEPEGLAKARAALLRFLDADPARWDFWARWYRGMFDGQPMDWALQRAVALIPDDVWQAGPEAVAQRIAEIEAEFRGDPLDQDALRAHVEAISKSAAFHADAAESVATTLDTAIRSYCQKADANELPEGFRQFTRIEAKFRSISITLRQTLPTEDKTAELQTQINDLHGIVGTLQRELAEARAQLIDTRLSALEGERQRRSGSALLTTLASFATIGAFGLGAMTFFGVKAEDFGYETVRRDAVALAEEYAAPDRSQRPVPRPTAAPESSPRPEPRQPD